MESEARLKNRREFGKRNWAHVAPLLRDSLICLAHQEGECVPTSPLLHNWAPALVGQLGPGRKLVQSTEQDHLAPVQKLQSRIMLSTSLLTVKLACGLGWPVSCPYFSISSSVRGSRQRKVLFICLPKLPHLVNN